MSESAFNKVERIRSMLIEQKATLESAIADITNAALPLRAERAQLTEKIAADQARIYELNDLIKDLEQPDLGALQTQLQAVGMALTQKVMQIAEAEAAKEAAEEAAAAEPSEPAEGGSV